LFGFSIFALQAKSKTDEVEYHAAEIPELVEGQAKQQLEARLRKPYLYEMANW
jgi:hypothetical protein